MDSRHICSLFIHAIMVMLFTMVAWLPLSAQQASSRLQLPTDLMACLMIASPGEGPVSCYGHCALRLACPSVSKDYFFTYGFADTMKERARLTVGKAAARFWIMNPHRYLSDYESEGRTVREYRLNLTIEEIRRLWMLLDRASHADATRNFDPVRDHCSSACLRKVEECLGNGSIVWGRLPTTAECTYREFLTLLSKDNPWAGFLWKTFLGADGDERSPLQVCLAPSVVVEAMRHAYIEEPDGSHRPLLGDGGKGKVVCRGSDDLGKAASNTVSPLAVALSLFILVLVLTILEWSTNRSGGSVKKMVRVVSTVFDVLLLVAHTCFSAFFMIVASAPQLHSSHGNVRLMVFNIAPALVAVWSMLIPSFHYSHAYRCLWLTMAVSCVLFVICRIWSPQVETVYMLLALAFAMRCVACFLRSTSTCSTATAASSMTS